MSEMERGWTDLKSAEASYEWLWERYQALGRECHDALREARRSALLEAAEVAKRWGTAQVAKWADHHEMCEDAKSRAWDATVIANEIRSLADKAGSGI